MKRMLIVLSLVMIIAGVVLAGVYTAFQPRIAANRERALNESLGALFDSAQELSFQLLDLEGARVYRAQSGGAGTGAGTGESGGGESVGYAVELTTTGYGGEIRLLVGLSADREELTGIEIVEHLETPGLGARIDEAWFKEQFQGLDPEERLSYVKNKEPDPAENQIQAISGATISTEAVVSGINKKLTQILERIEAASAGASAPEGGE